VVDHRRAPGPVDPGGGGQRAGRRTFTVTESERVVPGVGGQGVVADRLGALRRVAEQAPGLRRVSDCVHRPRHGASDVRVEEADRTRGQ